MSDTWIRIFFRSEDGRVADGEQDYDLTSFAGVLPVIGDTILDPGVLVPLDRRAPENRRVWKVVDRVFNCRDTENCVGLVVETRTGKNEDKWL